MSSGHRLSQQMLPVRENDLWPPRLFHVATTARWDSRPAVPPAATRGPAADCRGGESEADRAREGPHRSDQMTSLLQLMFSGAQTQGEGSPSFRRAAVEHAVVVLGLVFAPSVYMHQGMDTAEWSMKKGGVCS